MAPCDENWAEIQDQKYQQVTWVSLFRRTLALNVRLLTTAFCSSSLSFVLNKPPSNVFRSKSTRSVTLRNSGLASTRLLAPSSAVLLSEN